MSRRPPSDGPTLAWPRTQQEFSVPRARSLILCSNLLNIGETAAYACEERLHSSNCLGWHSPQTLAEGYCLSARYLLCAGLSFSGGGLGMICPKASPKSANKT